MAHRRVGFWPGRLWRVRGDALGLCLVLLAGAALRLYGLDWDGGQWLHPDERQIYFVVARLAWPHTLAGALSPDSPLNPAFFAYGSLPFYLLKAVAASLAFLSEPLADPDNLHWIGRPLASLLDLATVLLTYRLARVLYSSPGCGVEPTVGADSGTGSDVSSIGERGTSRTAPMPAGNCVALLAATLVALALLHVQLAHFYTADTLLAFTVMLTLNLAASVLKGGGKWSLVGLGAALGLALATKISAFPLAFTVAVACALWSPAGGREGGGARRWVLSASMRTLAAMSVAGLVFVAVQPYILIDWSTFVAHTAREGQIARGVLDVPYTRQYAGTLPYLYSMWQTALWGLGLPLGVTAWTALGLTLIAWLRKGGREEALLLAWVVPYLAVAGFLHVRYLRYMLPLIPVLCILAARLLLGGERRRRLAPAWFLAATTGLFSLTLVIVYARPHSWIDASEWIYEHVPEGGTLAVEEWDTPLPLPVELGGRARRADEFELRTLPLYGEPDDAAKWSMIAGHLSAADYAVVASRRLYGSIPRLPDRYPVAARYHDLLFGGQLGYERVGEFERGPSWLNPRIPPLPDAAPALVRPDESFVVYDHPRTLLFRNAEHLAAEELLERLRTP